jgi:hypothetical protein
MMPRNPAVGLTSSECTTGGIGGSRQVAHIDTVNSSTSTA